MRFDQVRRSGRFDMVLQIMQPNLKAKLGNKAWVEPLSRAIDLAAKVGQDEKAVIEGIIAELTFLETKELVREIGRTEDDKLLAVVRNAGEVCTLNKRNDVPLDFDEEDPKTPSSVGPVENADTDAPPRSDGNAGTDIGVSTKAAALTWRRTSELEAKQMRLPTPA